jgi:hypothetical protein
MYLARPASGSNKPAQNPKSVLSGLQPASCEGNARSNCVTDQTYIDGFNEALMLSFEIIARLKNAPFQHNATGFGAFEAEARKMRDAARSRTGGQNV